MVNLEIAGGFILGAIVSVVIISNPASTSAIFIALTNEMDHKQKIEVAKRSIRFSIGILLFFALTGLLLFQLFGFSIGAFRIAGGILLFTTAVTMLNPRPSSEQAEEKSRDIALIPLAIPFIAGPGTITTVVVLMSEAQNFSGEHGLTTSMVAMAGVLVAIAVTIVISYLMMSNSERIDARLKEGGRAVMTRLMGLIVMAIAIQFIINGIKDEIPAFMDIIEGTGGAGLIPIL